MPGDCSLIAGIQARAALDAILELKMDIVCLIEGIAVGRAHIRRAFMRARGITDIRIDLDMSFGFTPPLIPVIDQPEPVRDGELLHKAVAIRRVRL